MAQAGSSGLSSAGTQVKPSLSHALWGQLLHKSIPPSLHPITRGTGPSTQVTTPTAPIDRNGTSVRMLLHDTQATLEKFSSHVERLTNRVDDAKREIATAHKVFHTGQEKMIEENVDLVNRCQTEIKRSLGVPAQAAKVDEVLKCVAGLDSRLDRLDRQVEALNMLTQTQMKALQCIQEQQIQLLTMISPMLPLLQAVPLHVDSAKADIKELVRELPLMLCSFNERLSPKHSGAGPSHAPPQPSNSAHGKPRTKKRRIDKSHYADASFGSDGGGQCELDCGAVTRHTARKRALSRTSSLLGSPRPGPTLGHQRKQSDRLVFGSTSPSPRAGSAHSGADSVPARSPQPRRNLPARPTSSSSASTARPRRHGAEIPPAVAVDRQTMYSPTRSPPTHLSNPPSPFSSLNMEPAQESPRRPTQSQLTSIPGTSSAHLRFAASRPTTPTAPLPSPLDDLPGPDHSPHSQPMSSARDSHALQPKTEALVFDEATALFGHVDPDTAAATNKPMSLKDIRARGIDAVANVNERKRYIVLDDEDDEDPDCFF